MNLESFKIKIYGMFIVLATALIAMALYFVYIKFEASRDYATQLLSVRIAEVVDELMHDIQLEREMSVGFLSDASHSPAFSQVLAQYDRTDQRLKEFNEYRRLKSFPKQDLENKLRYYNLPHLKHLRRYLNQLQTIRSEVIAQKIDFDQIVEYYTSVNDELVKLFYGLMWLTRDKYTFGMDVYRLERIEEAADLEKIRIYHLLTGQRYYLREISKIRQLIVSQNNKIKRFRENLSPEEERFFRSMISEEDEERVRKWRSAFFRYQLTRDDAPAWLRDSNRRIDNYDHLSARISQQHEQYIERDYQSVRQEMYAFLLLLILLVWVLFVLIMMLRHLLKIEEELVDNLEIASYAFEAEEAMVITDAHDRALKTNQAFTDITGYTQDEILGQNINLLRSDRTPPDLFMQMRRALAREGYWHGEIVSRNKEGEDFYTRLSVTRIHGKRGRENHYIYHFLDISDLKHAEEEARYQASHDFLTGLPNRKAMLEEIQSILLSSEREKLSALLFIDLDDFKRLNDTYGHATGDRMLTEVAYRLQNDIGSGDFVARIGGDEFCIILKEIAEDPDEAMVQARTVCEKILSTLAEPFDPEQFWSHIGASIGIRIFPDHVRSVDEIIVQADAAMYKAKELGKNRFVFFDKAIEQKMLNMIQYESELHNAMENGEIVFYYQPKVAFRNGNIVGAELMVRWKHPRHGLLYPDDFLEAFEKLTLIGRLSERALEAACVMITSGRVDSSISFSINVSVYELRSSLFVNKTIETIEHYGVDPQRIEIEILEHALIDDFDAVIENMNQLKAFGVRFSIDDFGAGYSSINYLNQLPADILKIDRKFVELLHKDDVRAYNVIRMIARFARLFKVNTVIEGVETKEEYRLLKKIGLDYYQGFYFSEAVDEERFVALLGGEDKKIKN